MSDGYVPQVGHLVELERRVYIVTYVEDYVCQLATLGKDQWLGCYNNERLTFLADRSAEWARLFDLNTPTP